MSTPPLMQQTPILVRCLADAIGTSPEDAAEHLAECDAVFKGRGFSGEEGLTNMVRELIETGD